MSIDTSDGNLPGSVGTRPGRRAAESDLHTVQFYGDDVVLLGDLSDFVASALDVGGGSVVIASREHREGIEARLARRGSSLAAAARQGRYVALDATETLATIAPNGVLDPARFSDRVDEIIARVAAAVGKPTRIAVFGELVALLRARGHTDAAIELERLWNAAIQRQPFRLHCAYPMSLFGKSGDDEAMVRICAEHSRVIPTESYTALANEDERLRAVALLQQRAQSLENEIAARVEAEQALRERNQELRKAIAIRDEFLSVAAHELKTPLTSLRGFAQLMVRKARRMRGASDGYLETALTAIEQQTIKLDQLVTRMLDSAQIEAGHLRIDPIPTDLVALVRSTLGQFSCHERHTIVLDAPARLEAVVDPLRFEQVVVNLIGNAIKFSPWGGTVEVAIRRGEREARLTVTDCGLGIPPDERERVFDRFYRAHVQHHLSGLGLGLFVTREIVQLHGGSIWVEATDAQGARLVVTLPLDNRQASIAKAARVSSR